MFIFSVSTYEIYIFFCLGILVTASQGSKNEYDYNIVSVVLMTEFFKLLTSVGLYCKEYVSIYWVSHHFKTGSYFSNSPRTLVKDIYKDRKVLYLYFVPAFLYCLYNNLSFLNLSTFDPTTYYLLLQLRVVVTAILFQVSCFIQAKAFRFEFLIQLWTPHCLIDSSFKYNYLTVCCPLDIAILCTYQTHDSKHTFWNLN